MQEIQTGGASLRPAQAQLEARLREVDERLRSEMRARGFDPAQDEHLALTGPLAKLYLERENLRDELATMGEQETSTSESDPS